MGEILNNGGSFFRAWGTIMKHRSIPLLPVALVVGLTVGAINANAEEEKGNVRFDTLKGIPAVVVSADNLDLIRGQRKFRANLRAQPDNNDGTFRAKANIPPQVAEGLWLGKAANF